MADFYLVGNLEEDEDLWLISNKHKRAVPVPKSVWLEVVSIFQAEEVSADPDEESSRNRIAMDILNVVENQSDVSRNVNLSLSASELASVVVNVRLLPLELLAQENHPLMEILRDYVELEVEE